MLDGLWGDDKSTEAASAPSGVGAGLAPDLATAKDGEAVAKLYNEGLANLKDGSNKSAVKDFSEVERQYPYSSWATKAIIMQAYAHYSQGNFDDTVVAANRFITLHPGHKDAGYAYYLIAIANYNKIQDTRRDQTATRQALDVATAIRDAGRACQTSQSHHGGLRHRTNPPALHVALQQPPCGSRIVTRRRGE